jgi:putative SOS response-associated peptidase YedK
VVFGENKVIPWKAFLPAEKMVSFFPMCGRFTLQISPEMLAQIFGLIETPSYPARYNIAPSQKVAVIRQTAGGQNRLDFLRWGLIPSWAEDASIGYKLINGRSETVHEKHSFRHAIRYRRCLIPASGLYEWLGEGNAKKPQYIRMKDDSPMIFAGLWENWKSPGKEVVETCTILTTAANSLIAPFHDRMPVILHPQEFNLWLDREVNYPEDLKPLYRPYPPELMETYPVSPLVNSPKFDSHDLIHPFQETPELFS